jgi:hypothetical protein
MTALVELRVVTPHNSSFELDQYCGRYAMVRLELTVQPRPISLERRFWACFDIRYTLKFHNHHATIVWFSAMDFVQSGF